MILQGLGFEIVQPELHVCFNIGTLANLGLQYWALCGRRLVYRELEPCDLWNQYAELQTNDHDGDERNAERSRKDGLMTTMTQAGAMMRIRMMMLMRKRDEGDDDVTDDGDDDNDDDDDDDDYHGDGDGDDDDECSGNGDDGDGSATKDFT